jgi:hypothetical protein
LYPAYPSGEVRVNEIIIIIIVCIVDGERDATKQEISLAGRPRGKS